MCLKRLTQKRKLKKDKKVWKSKTVYSEHEYPCVNFYCTILNPFHVYPNYFPPPKSLVGKNIAVQNPILSERREEYISGFHCFTKPHKKTNLAGEMTIAEFIIPAGTTVQYGYQEVNPPGREEHVVVTPVLNNPRAKE